MARLFEGALDELHNAERHYLEAARLAPDHVAAVRGARRILLAGGKHASALPLFDQEMRATPDPKRRAVLSYRKGRVLEDGLERRDDARKCYSQALELDRDNASVLKAIERSERKAGAWAALGRTYGQLASSLPSDARLRAAWMTTRARIAETREKDPKLAVELYRAALDLDPRAPQALAALKRLARSQRLWNELLAALSKEVQLAQEPQTRSRALVQMAHVQRTALGDTAAAVVSLEKAYEQDPNDRRIVKALAEHYTSTGRNEALASALTRLAETASDPRERASLAHRLGMHFGDVLEDRDRARRWLEIALSVDPAHGPSQLALAALYETLGDHEALANLQHARIAATDDPKARAEAHASLGRLFEERLGRKEEAVQHYAEALGLDATRDDAFKALDRLLTGAGRYRELAELYQRKVDRAAEEAQAIGFLFRIGAIYEDRLDEPETALHAYERILERAPENLGAIQALARAAERAGKHDRLVRALEWEAKLASAERSHELEVRAARTIDQHLNDPERAIAKLREVLAKDVAHREALDALAAMLQRLGRFDDLLVVHERRLEITPRGPLQIALLFEMAELCRTRLARLDDAIGLYKRALTVDASHDPSYGGLVSCLEERERWPELAQALEKRIAQASDPSTRAHLACDVAEIYEERLRQPERALTAYDQALSARPGLVVAVEARNRLLTDKGAWQRLTESLAAEADAATTDSAAIDALLRAGEVHFDRLDDAAAATDCYQQVLARDANHAGALLALEEIYEKTGDVKALGDVYRRQADVLGDEAARVAALRELSRVERDDRLLRETYETILSLERGDEEALEGLAAMARARKDEAALIGLEARLATATTDPTLTAFHQARVAEQLERVGGPGALESYRAALALDPESMSVTRGFTRVARAAADPDALREAAEREARVTNDIELAVDLLLHAAVVRGERRDSQGAVADLEKALELDPDNREVAVRLKNLLIALGQVPYLVDVLGRAAGNAHKPERAADLFVMTAELHAERREDLPAALAACDRALAKVSKHIGALTHRAAYLERSRQWSEAADALRRVVEHSKETTVLMDAHLRLAAICDEHLGDVDQAIRSLRAVLVTDEKNHVALSRLCRILLGRGNRDEALVLAQRLVETAEDPTERSAALVEVARIEKARKRPVEAAGALMNAVALSGPSNPAAEELQKLIGHAENATWDSYLGVLMRYKDLASRMHAPVGDVYLAISHVFGDHMNRPDRAMTTLREGIEREPSSAPLVLALGDRLARAGNHDRVIDEMRRFLEHDVTHPDIWRRLARALGAVGEGEESITVLSTLLVLENATPEETMVLRTRRTRTATAPPGLLGDNGIRQLQVNGAHDMTPAALTAAIDEVFAKLYPIDFSRYGVSKRDRLRAGSGDAVRSLADRIAAIFGVIEFELYVHDEPARDVGLEPGSPASVFVPRWATQLGQPALTFMLARPLAHAARALNAIMRVSPAELESVLDSAAGAYNQDYPGGDIDLGRQISKHVSRRNRRTVEEAANRYAAARPPIDGWIHDTELTAMRAALLVADDLHAVVKVLEKTRGTEVGRDHVIDDLVRFWASDTAVRFRRVLRQAG